MSRLSQGTKLPYVRSWRKKKKDSWRLLANVHLNQIHQDTLWAIKNWRQWTILRTRRGGVVVWIRIASIGSYIWLLSQQGVAPLEKDEGVWPCWKKYVTGGGLWGFQKSMLGRVSVCLSVCLSSVCLSQTGCSSQLLPQHHVFHACSHAPHHDNHGLNLWKCKQAPS